MRKNNFKGGLKKKRDAVMRIKGVLLTLGTRRYCLEKDYVDIRCKICYNVSKEEVVNMPIIERTVTICKCIKCGYEWEPRQKVEDIKQCPHCRTKHWDKPKIPKWRGKK